MTTAARNRVDLHTHTSRSDGVLTPRELYAAMAAAGMRLVVEASVDGSDFIYRYWVHANESAAYQVMAWGAKGDRAQVISEADRLISTFKVLPGK